MTQANSTTASAGWRDAEMQPCDGKSSFVKEGKAEIGFDGPASAFYNPVQEFNRDLTVAVMRQFIKDNYGKEDSEQQQPLVDLSCSTADSSTNGDEISDASTSEPLSKRRKQKTVLDRKGVRVLDALSASGLRAVRFALEVPGITSVVANDFSSAAVDTIRANVKRNNVDHLVDVHFGDASSLMYGSCAVEKRFEIVDLDPYGSPSHFLDAAVQSVADGGLLMVTATDMAVLCGNTPETCHAKYGSVPFRSKACHETALRILLRCIEAQANKYSRYIQPLVSLSIDFYIRVFVRIFTSASQVKRSLCKLSNVYQCVGCGTITLQPMILKQETGVSLKFSLPHGPAVNAFCEHCGCSHQVAGPLWSAPIHDQAFLSRMLSSLSTGTAEDEAGDDYKLGTCVRLRGVISMMIEELPDVPLFYELASLTSVIRIPVPKLRVVRCALLNAGYRVGVSHTCATALQTDAPMQILWDILRTLAKQANVTGENKPENDPGRRILAKEITFVPNFASHANGEPKTKAEGFLRFQNNKGKNWGPKQKTKGSINSIKASTYSQQE